MLSVLSWFVNMDRFTSSKAVGAPKDYNMWKDDIWKDAPSISPTGWTDFPINLPIKSIWSDMPNTAPIKPVWSTPQKASPPKSSSEYQCKTPEKTTPPKSSEFQCFSTPEKSKNPSVDLDTSPRTSTPVPDDSIEDILDCSENSADQYECFKNHLNESPKKLKVRGAVLNNKTIISGHIDMKNLDPFSYTFEHHYVPKINMCFINLLLNGPAPLMCQEHYDPNYPNNFVSNCHCLPVCNCRANIATNRNLPIGYKYTDEGFVVPTVPPMPPRPHQRNPNCIYTV